MAKSKWDSVKDKLVLVEAWARDGLIDTEIAKKLGISKATLENYKRDHLDFLDSLKRGKEVIDVEVENSLLKRAIGYKYKETTQELVASGENGKKELQVTKIIEKEVVPDTTAQIFWLKNRKPEQWRDKPDEHQIDNQGESDNLFSAIAEAVKKI